VKTLRKVKSVLVLGHQNADADAVCSAFAFMALARRINRRLRLDFSAPEGMSKLSKQIVTAIPLEVEEHPNFSEVDLIVTVDTNTLQQLGEFRKSVLESGRPIVMIDHHAPHPENARTASMVLCDESSTSTCEVILDMYEKLRLKPDRLVSQALLVGLLVETGHLSIATRRTYKATCQLILAGADPEKAHSLTRMTMDESERIARVRSAQRMRLERVGRWLVASSEVGSYHASAARALVALGAHLAIVAGKRDDELTVSFRSTRDFLDGTNLHLGTDLAGPLGTRMGGMGGGHATAAGANVKGNVDEALKLALEIVRARVSESSKPNIPGPSKTGHSSQTGVITQ